ncbi:hypothetical protein [uncultured Brevundimonas sp.]|mgnify:CR=1 FL=1|uniref:hypothetical protein n=1 Tax=uncultured Brevundimonas sp. TaxID=213418 RepID=UPI0030EE76E2|tara:strand:- start:1219 stop:1497 length:279 start_codon:yes stop_codon:yes gene_type:complete
MTDIDSLLAHPAERSADAQLDTLEQRVWQRVGLAEERRHLGRIRTLAVTGALLFGVINGGFGLLVPATPPSEIGVLTLAAGLSPLSGMGIVG